jgi:hypothetical protein
MSNVIHVAPFVHVDNLDRALAFFTDIRGSETPFRVADHAYVQREGFRILQQTGDDGAPQGNRRSANYIEVATSISPVQNSSPCSRYAASKAMFRAG